MRWPASFSSSRAAAAVAHTASSAARGGGFGSRDVDASRARRHRAHQLLARRGAAPRPMASSHSTAGSARASAARCSAPCVGAFDANLSARFTDRELHFPDQRLWPGRRQQRRAPRRSPGRRDSTPAIASSPRAHASCCRSRRTTCTASPTTSPTARATQGYAYTTAERSRRRSGDVRLELGSARRSRLTLGAQVERKWQETSTRSNFGDDVPLPARRRSTGALRSAAPRTDLRLHARARWAVRAQRAVRRLLDVSRRRQRVSSRHRPALRASVGTAFREPTFLETEGSGFVIGNRALDPEHAFSVDAGIEQAIGDGARSARRSSRTRFAT